MPSLTYCAQASMAQISCQSIYFCTFSVEPWGICDRNGQYVFMNASCCNLLNIREESDLKETGLPYGNISILAGLERELHAHDQEVVKTGQRIDAIGTLLIDNEYMSFIFERFPYYDSSGLITGIFCHLKPFGYMSTRFFLEKSFYGKTTHSPPTHLFTEREWDVLFMLFNGLNKAKIAETLGISAYSVRNILSKLYLKANVESKEGLLELGYKENWESFVPTKCSDTAACTARG